MLHHAIDKWQKKGAILANFFYEKIYQNGSFCGKIVKICTRLQKAVLGYL